MCRDWDCTLEGANRASETCRRRGAKPPSSGAARHLLPHGRRDSLHPRHAAMAADIRATHAVRLGFRQINGLREDDMQQLVERRGAGYDSVRDLWLRTGLDAGRARATGRRRRLPLARPRPARGAVGGARARPRRRQGRSAAVFGAPSRRASTSPTPLPPMPLGEHVVEDYRHLSLSLKAPSGRLPARGASRRAASCAASALAGARHPGARVTVAGLVLVRQRPGTGQGRDLHDARGRDRHRQHHRLAESLRSAAPDRHRRAFRRRDRQAAERDGRHPCDRRADRGSDADARPVVRARPARSTAAPAPTKRAARRPPTATGGEARAGGVPQTRRRWPRRRSTWSNATSSARCRAGGIFNEAIRAKSRKSND